MSQNADDPQRDLRARRRDPENDSPTDASEIVGSADQTAARALRLGALLGVAFLAASAGWDALVASERLDALWPWRAGAAAAFIAAGFASYALPRRAAIIGAAMALVGAASIGVVVGQMPHGLVYGTGSFVLVGLVIGFVALDGKAALAAALSAALGGFVALWFGGASGDAMLAIAFFYVPSLAGAVLVAHTSHVRLDRARELKQRLEQLREDLARFGRHDELTGVHDERQLQQLARREIALARRRKTALSAIKIDVERLDDINVKHGRPTGDETLRAVASMCQATLRETDLLARLSAGDEFAAVLPEADAVGAEVICERLKKSLAKASVLAGGQMLEVTVNVAAATLSEGDHQIDDLLKRADSALKAQKTAPATSATPTTTTPASPASARPPNGTA